MASYNDFGVPQLPPNFMPDQEVEGETKRLLRRSLSQAGTLSNTVQPGQSMLPNTIERLRGRASDMYDRASQMMDQPLDYSGLQAFAKQRGQQGEQAMLNALAAQYAGEGFAPLQQQFIKTAASTQEPIKMGGGMITNTGQFIKDPEVAQDKQVQMLLNQAKAYEQQALTAETARERIEAQRRHDQVMEQLREAQMRMQADQQQWMRQYQTDSLNLRREVANKDARLPFNAVQDLAKQAGMAETMSSISATFKPEYASRLPGVPGVGAAENYLGRAGIGNTDRANWWQNYNEQANIIRNSLFGSALTLTEKAAFEAAMISPDMAPDVIKTRLAQQAAAAQRAYQKIVAAAGSSGYNVSGLPTVSGPTTAPAPGGGTPAPGGGLSAAEQAELDALRAKHGRK